MVNNNNRHIENKGENELSKSNSPILVSCLKLQQIFLYLSSIHVECLQDTEVPWINDI